MHFKFRLQRENFSLTLRQVFILNQVYNEDLSEVKKVLLIKANLEVY